MKIVHISDTHQDHWSLHLPNADLLAITGDLSSYGSTNELIQFNHWLEALEGKFREILLIPGNHDKQFNDFQFAKNLVPRARVLFDESFEFDGYKIYGSPWTCEFGNWHFMKQRGAPIRAKWRNIPDDVNILLTHQPPYGTLDSAEDMNPPHKLISVGCKDLMRRIPKLKNLKLHCFGHLHADGGQIVKKDGIIYSNGAVKDDNYRTVHGINVIDLL